MLDNKREQIFISYARENDLDKKSLYSKLIAKLDLHKIVIWDDSRIPPGKFEEEIKTQIAHSSIYLLLISNAFMNSTFIKKELDWILKQVENNPHKVIIPILLKDLTKSELEKRLASIADNQFYPKGFESVYLHKNRELAWSELISQLGVDISNKKPTEIKTPKWVGYIILSFFASVILFILYGFYQFFTDGISH